MEDTNWKMGRTAFKFQYIDKSALWDFMVTFIYLDILSSSELVLKIIWVENFSLPFVEQPQTWEKL